MAQPATDASGFPASLAAELDSLSLVLGEAVALMPLGGRAERGRLVELLRSARDGCQRAADAARRLTSGAPPDDLNEWLHDLRARVGTIAGWTRFLSQRRDEPTWVRTADVLERNTKILIELLEHPPATSA